MAGGVNLVFADNISMLFTSLVQGLRDDFSHPIGFVQIVTIGVSFLIAWLFARKFHHYFDKSTEKIRAHTRIFGLMPTQSAQLLAYLFWLLLMWFSKELFIKFTIPITVLLMTFNLVGALIVIRFASFYIQSVFWSRFVWWDARLS